MHILFFKNGKKLGVDI